jgi:hypothetical protein
MPTPTSQYGEGKTERKAKRKRKVKRVVKAVKKTAKNIKKKKYISKGLKAAARSGLLSEKTSKRAMAASNLSRRAGWGKGSGLTVAGGCMPGRGLKRAGGGLKRAGGARKPNPWISHVKAYSKKHKCSYKEAMKCAGSTYKK